MLALEGHSRLREYSAGFRVNITGSQRNLSTGLGLYIAIVKTENALIDKFQEGSILEQNDLAQDKGQINLILFSYMFLK